MLQYKTTSKQVLLLRESGWVIVKATLWTETLEKERSLYLAISINL